MLFVEPIFLFAFLPLLLLVLRICPAAHQNTALLIASLVFYAWGEPLFTPLLMATMLINYEFGKRLDAANARGNRPLKSRRTVFALAIGLNLAVLVVFKYAGFLWQTLASPLHGLDPENPPIPIPRLPLGISFFTFQAMSYLTDVYRGLHRAQGNPRDLALYIGLFPQLIAGPIVRYREIAHSLQSERRVPSGRFNRGATRFVVGLGKKMILANTFAVPADAIFGMPPGELSAATAWLGTLCYALQIYFDFSGYTDMAIGLGHLLGFRFPENFRYPYAATSMTDFWRRWHQSLTRWFRDYLYIPLGGNRVEKKRRAWNLLTVFVLCGLWHGAAWNFLVWGLLHGAFLATEKGMIRTPRRGRSSRVATPWLGRAYVWMALLVTWVVFRRSDLHEACSQLGVMFGILPGSSEALPVHYFASPELIVLSIAGILAAGPTTPWIRRFLARRCRQSNRSARQTLLSVAYGCRTLGLSAVLIYSLSQVAAESYNPFIYFRF